MEKKKVLFITADPIDAPLLSSNKEVREIDKVFNQTRLGDKFELKYCLAAQVEDLSDALLRENPQIIHFSGHGSDEGLSLQDKNGKEHLISTESLVNFLKLFKDQVECVLLNACFTNRLASEISPYIRHVIGLKGETNDEAARLFAIEFYKALGTGWTIENAFNFAKVAKDLSGSDAKCDPVLFVQCETVSLPEKEHTSENPAEKAVKIFISYVDRDEQLRQELELQLIGLQRQGIIDTWHDQKINLGEERETAILKHLSEAQIVLLLVSARFIASDKYNVEVELAMQRRRTDGIRVIPIILRSCDWRLTSFGGLQPLPRNELPIIGWSDVDEAFYNVALELKEIIQRMNQ